MGSSYSKCDLRLDWSRVASLELAHGCRADHTVRVHILYRKRFPIPKNPQPGPLALDRSMIGFYWFPSFMPLIASGYVLDSFPRAKI